jgi:hypothetical protein
MYVNTEIIKVNAVIYVLFHMNEGLGHTLRIFGNKLLRKVFR